MKINLRNAKHDIRDIVDILFVGFVASMVFVGIVLVFIIGFKSAVYLMTLQ